MVFTAHGMIFHGGDYQNYWGEYWTCECGRSWSADVTACNHCGGDKPDKIAQDDF